jgi:hypothetical protein
MPEITIQFLMDNLNVRERGFTSWTPVDQSLRAVEQLIIPQPDESFTYSPRETFIHSESFMIPVARDTQGSQLMQNGIAGFVLP